MSSSSPRSARASRLLAVVLVPLVALPALAGLVVCTSATGVTTSWGERPCPRKGSTPAITAPGESALACVLIPDVDPGPAAAAPALSALATDVLAVATAQVPALRTLPVARRDEPRGPPRGALDALRTVVLRV